jgi:methylmalonyl-CoA mutase
MMGGTSDAGNVFLQNLSLDGVFPEVGLDDWRAAAGSAAQPAANVRGVEGLPVATLYTRDDLPRGAGYPGLPPFTRGRRPAPQPWEVCQVCADPDPEAARQRLEALDRHGVHGVWLQLDRHVRLGTGAEAAAGDGLVVARLDDLLTALSAADPARLAIRVLAGGNALAVTGLLVAATRARGSAVAGSVDIDPLGALVSDGELPGGLDEQLSDMATVAAWADSSASRLQTVMVSSLPYHNAGASAIEETAFSLATCVLYLRTLTGSGLTVDQAASRMRMVVGVGRDAFLAAARIRALRRLVSAVVRLSGGAPAGQAMPVHAVCSPRSLAARDPWVNLLRTTVETWAAIVAGADAITSWPFDAAIGPADGMATRLAANTQTILREEAHLNRVADPAGGSYYVERLSDDLARSAWALFQEIERRGGMASCVLDGWVQERVEATMRRRSAATATRSVPITGVSTFANLSEPSVERPTVDARALGRRLAARSGGAARPELEELVVAARSGRRGELVELAAAAFTAGATMAEVGAILSGHGQPQRMPALELRREGVQFERLRDASDRHLEATGRRPQTFVVTLGTTEEHRARLGFARHVLSTGGVASPTVHPHSAGADTAAALAASDTSVVVVCGSDERCRQALPGLAVTLKEHGARRVLVVARPGDVETQWLASGVDDLIYDGCNVLEVVAGVHRAEGVADV